MMNLIKLLQRMSFHDTIVDQEINMDKHVIGRPRASLMTNGILLLAAMRLRTVESLSSKRKFHASVQILGLV